MHDVRLIGRIRGVRRAVLIAWLAYVGDRAVVCQDDRRTSCIAPRDSPSYQSLRPVVYGGCMPWPEDFAIDLAVSYALVIGFPDCRFHVALDDGFVRRTVRLAVYPVGFCCINGCYVLQ